MPNEIKSFSSSISFIPNMVSEVFCFRVSCFILKLFMVLHGGVDSAASPHFAALSPDSRGRVASPTSDGSRG